jgi:hypothetical protein
MMRHRTTSPEEVIHYAVISLIGVRADIKPFSQHFNEVRNRWNEYYSWRQGKVDKEDVERKLRDYNFYLLEDTAVGLAYNEGLDIEKDFETHYNIALNHVKFLFENRKKDLGELESAILDIDNKLLETKGKQKLAVVQDLEDGLRKIYGFKPYNAAA